jgi:hypothetical protein
MNCSNCATPSAKRAATATLFKRIDAANATRLDGLLASNT